MENTWRLTLPDPLTPVRHQPRNSPTRSLMVHGVACSECSQNPEPQRGRWSGSTAPLSLVGPHPPARFTAHLEPIPAQKARVGRGTRPLPECSPITARARAHLLVGRCDQRSPAPRPIASQLQRAVRRALEGAARGGWEPGLRARRCPAGAARAARR